MYGLTLLMAWAAKAVVLLALPALLLPVTPLRPLQESSPEIFFWQEMEVLPQESRQYLPRRLGFPTALGEAFGPELGSESGFSQELNPGLKQAFVGTAPVV